MIDATDCHASNSPVLDSCTLFRSLQGVTCPACRRHKKAHQTFCWRCYRRLNQDQQFALYRRIGSGYAEAVADACRTLRVEFYLPEGTDARARR